MTLNITCKCKMCGGNNKMKDYNGAKFYDCEYCGTSQLVDNKYINEYTQECDNKLARLEAERLYKENLEKAKQINETLKKCEISSNEAAILQRNWFDYDYSSTEYTEKTNYLYWILIVGIPAALIIFMVFMAIFWIPTTLG